MTNNNSQPIRQAQGENGSTPLTTRGFAMAIIIALVAVVLVLGGVAYYANRPQIENNEMVEEKDMMPARSDAEQSGGDKKGDEMMKGETMMKYSGAVLAGKSAPLLDYNKVDYDAAIASNKLVVLYFYANWCPICKEETKNALYPAFNELTTDKVVGIRINYKDSDTTKDEEDLARQYGIPYQHTKVFVKNGKQILKSPESWNKERHLSEINKASAQ